MLAQLRKYAEDRGLVSEPGFAAKTVHYALDIDSDGQGASLIPLGDGKGRLYDRCPNLSQPEMIAGGVKRSQFLVESVAAILLLGKTPEDLEKAKPRREFYLGLLAKASEEPGLEGLGVCAEFLRNQGLFASLQEQALRDKVKLTDQVTLKLDGADILQDWPWADWWRRYRSSQPTKPSKREDKVQMLDLLTAELVTPAPTHFKVNGLAGIGGLGTGDSLVSFDKAAFQSYGLDQSLNAAMSENSARLYADVLNQLLRDSKKFANVKICYWFSRKLEADPMDWIFGGDEDETRFGEVILKLRKGESDPLDLKTVFYCLSLSGSSGRVMVRDWSEGNLQELRSNVARWYEDLEIIGPRDGQMAKPPKLFGVVASLYRETKDIVDNQALQLFRSATLGTPIPKSCLAQALQRFRVDLIGDQPFRAARMGLMKAYFLRKKGGFSMSALVAEDHPDPAYHCGRLLAALSKLQYEALGDVGAGVVQRFFGASSQAPALSFGRLLSGSQHHLNKLRGDFRKRKLAPYYEELIGRISAAVGAEFPRSLNLERQALFALGYYQQIAQQYQDKNQEVQA
ncbi:type I-C CRISPR-associated protein Cas8c/Csd1 [bacterium]|nr:type I-C CRISPR-associated protein Cas8c/Csd1 [bacterium]